MKATLSQLVRWVVDGRMTSDAAFAGVLLFIQIKAQINIHTDIPENTLARFVVYISAILAQKPKKAPAAAISKAFLKMNFGLNINFFNFSPLRL